MWELVNNISDSMFLESQIIFGLTAPQEHEYLSPISQIFREEFQEEGVHFLKKWCPVIRDCADPLNFTYLNSLSCGINQMILENPF